VAHPAANGDNLKVTIDCCELSRPAWLPDLIAEHQPRLFDWRAVLNRFSHMIEAVSADDAPFREKQWRIDFTHPLPAQCTEALASHPAVSAILISDQEHAAR